MNRSTIKERCRSEGRPLTLAVRNVPGLLFDALRERIVAGEIPSDQAIRQDALAAEFGVSKIPLREALARLEQDGLLTLYANRGYFVQPMSSAHADEIYDLRIRIEPYATARACVLATDSERAAACAQFELLKATGFTNLPAMGLQNRHFHAALLLPGSQLLTAQIAERLLVLSERYVIAHLRPEGRGSRAHKEHHNLLKAWLARDTVTVERLVADHVRSTQVDLLRQLGAKGNA